MLVFIISIRQHEFNRRAHGWQYSVGKTLIGDLWYVDESINNNFTNEFTNGKSTQKKI